MAIGPTIKALRTARNWTTTELADKAGLSQSYVSEIENGKDAGRGAQEKLAVAFGMSVPELLAALPPDSLAWFWRSRFASLRPSEILDFRNSKVDARTLWAIKQLLTAFSGSEIATRLGMTEAELTDLTAGRNDVSNWTVDLLSQRADVPVNFLLNGDVGPIDELVRRLLTDENCAAWLLLFDRARESNVPPEVIDRLLETALILTRK